ncbi:MAG: hypothetical protein R2727_06675 [Bacteroidales bacterium]
MRGKKSIQIDKPADVDFIIALLFSPHRLLREEATRYLRENFRDVYAQSRTPPFSGALAKKERLLRVRRYLRRSGYCHNFSPVYIVIIWSIWSEA